MVGQPLVRSAATRNGEKPHQASRRRGKAGGKHGFQTGVRPRNYMNGNHFPYLGLNLVAGATLCLYRPLKDAYLVRQYQTIPPPSPGLRHALIEAKQLPGAPYSRLSQLNLCGPLFYDDINVLKLALEFQGQTCDCSAYQNFKLFSIHFKRIRILPIRVKKDHFYGSTEPC